MGLVYDPGYGGRQSQRASIYFSLIFESIDMVCVHSETKGFQLFFFHFFSFISFCNIFHKEIFTKKIHIQNIMKIRIHFDNVIQNMIQTYHN